MEPKAISLSHFLPSPPPLASHHGHHNPHIKTRSSSPPTSEPTHHLLTTSRVLAHTPQLHARFVKTGDVRIAEKLIEMDIQSSDYSSASEVLSMALQCGSWSNVQLFLLAVLRLCAGVPDWRLGLQIHSLVIRVGLAGHARIKCSLVDFYARLGIFGSCKKLFAEAEVKDSVVLWNKLVVMHAEEEDWMGAVKVFAEMQLRGVRADGYTSAKVLHACGKLEALREGKAAHAYVVKAGLVSHPLVCNFLIGMYARNAAVRLATRVFESSEGKSLVAWNSVISCCLRFGFVDDAMALLERMIASGVEPNLVTWNAVLSGCSRHGRDREALDVLRRILAQGLSPDSSTVTSLLKIVGNLGLLRYGREIHGCFLRHELEPDVYTGTSLVNMYIKCGSLDGARRVFDTLEHKNVPTWNSLISGYANGGLFDKALELVKKMKREGLEPNITTWNGLISGYAMNGLSTQVMLLLRQIKATGVKPNVVTWTVLISGSCQNGEYDDSFYFFHEMREEGIQPSSVTVSILLRACAALALLKKGKELHCFVVRKGYHVDIVVATALIDMYSKSGSLQNAKRIFEKIQKKNLVCWNAMITGLAIHGQGREAISLFHEMCDSGIKPDSITFTALLSACRSMGLITEGWEYFDNMETCYGVTPTVENYACMVDLLARCGYLDEAMDFVERSPIEPEASFWGALLVGCLLHKNLDLAEVAARKLFRLEPYNSANYLLMMNLYEYEKMWEEAESLKYAMQARGVNSRAGWSWIQIDQTIHVFEVEGKPHPDIAEIYEELIELIFEMRKVGYVPDTSCILYDVPDEEKEKLLLSHTEKLAITYGLINSDMSAPIRVIKNTRMCNDCHEVAKYISTICNCDIILRDAVRFHHFVDGKCSCNDYW